MGYIASLNSVEPLLMAVNQPAPKLSGVMTKNEGALPALSSKILRQSKGTAESRVTEQSCLHLWKRKQGPSSISVRAKAKPAQQRH